MLPNHQPLVDRRAVRDARGAASRPHRPRDRPGARHRPGHRRSRCDAAMDPSADELPAQLDELLAFFDGDVPAHHGGPGARPEAGDLAARLERLQRPAGGRARAAVLVRPPFHAAEHDRRARRSTAQRFRPSATLAEPYAMVGVAVVCAETDEEARRLHGPRSSRSCACAADGPRPSPPPRRPPATHYTPDEREFIDSWTASHVVGSPETVRERLTDLQRPPARTS